MAKFVLKLNSLVFLSGLVLELTGFGFFAVYRDGRLSEYLVLITGNVIIVLAHYLFFVLLLPALNIVALLLNPVNQIDQVVNKIGRLWD